MAEKGTNILEGEASESDEEVTDYPSFVKNTMVSEPSPPSTPSVETLSVAPSSGVVVSGEASESDDEGGIMEVVGTRNFPSLQAQGLTEFELTIENEKEGDAKRVERRPLPKYQSPFHKKLREQNFSLRCGIVELVLDNYERAHSRLQSGVSHLTRTQADVQDTLHTIRKTADNVALISHRMKLINQHTSLPIIRFPEEA